MGQREDEIMVCSTILAKHGISVGLDTSAKTDNTTPGTSVEVDCTKIPWEKSG